MPDNAEFKFADVEEGSARVLIPTARGGHRTIGKVWSEKSGSGRTSIRWYARSSWYGMIGGHETRAGAAKLLVAEHARRNS